MESFGEFNINKQLKQAIEDLKFKTPTLIQVKSFPVIMSGSDMVGIAQTGTGKTFAYMLPILQNLPFSKGKHPRVLVVVPTRELVLQIVNEVKKFTKYLSIKCIGVYGGVNINTHKREVETGADIIVATPGRLYDLIISRALQLKDIKRLVIDEVDIMLDLGFRFQLINIFELLPTKRQNIMFSATMTEEVSLLIQDFFKTSVTVSVAVSGTPLHNIKQVSYPVHNFYTKANLLVYLLKNQQLYKKVLVFVSNKRNADLLFSILQEIYLDQVAVIHSNKTQNYRIRSIKSFNDEHTRILITTDVMARGLDLANITHVFNVNTPAFPENYMHRIGRTGRAEQKGSSILFYTKKEEAYKQAIESLMKSNILEIEFPKEVVISKKQTLEEQPKRIEANNPLKREEPLVDYHVKKEKNSKTNQGGSYKRSLKKKYKKPKTKGDKTYNKRNKKK